MTRTTNFKRVAEMNAAFGNQPGNPAAINVVKLRNQSRNILDEYCELQLALGASPQTVQALRDAAKGISYASEAIELDDVRDALSDIHVFAYGAHHIMGIDADKDMDAVVDGVMTRFVKDETDKQATIALHASRGVTHVYFEGTFPRMVMKSAEDQPDAPKGKFLKSSSYTNTKFHEPASSEAQRRHGEIMKYLSE